ncbi:circadian clock protein PASD1 isoform X3 [Rattus norvegicus]|nr:circadian clock protein PASD1 isoform X3 [Rattus norvegicus]
MMDRLGYGPSRERFRGRPARYQAAIASTSSQRGMLRVRTNYEQNEVPVFNTYEEYHKMVLQSFENISIVMNTDGKLIFVSQNVSPLLGHRPEDIMGKNLLNIVLDEQKDEVSEKIILNLPLANKVGSLIEFCCYIRKGNVCPSALDRYRYRAMYQGRDTYEYVKFILYLQDSYDESFVFFGHYGPNSRNIWSSAPRLLWEQQYYLVGNISVLRTPNESVQPVKVQTNVIVIESDDDNTIQPRRLIKRRRRSKMQRHAQSEVVNVEEHPESGTEVEIVDVQPATQRMPFELVQVRTSSRSSVSTDVSAATSLSAAVRTSTSTSSTDVTTTTPVSTPTSGLGYLMDPKNLLEPQDMEFEVAPEFLLNDSQEEQASTEQEECTEENVKKPLEELKGSISEDHGIDKDSAHHNVSSDDDCCIIENVQEEKDPKIKEAVCQEQEHQKSPETTSSRPTTPLQAVRPEAVVEPIVRTDLRVHGAEARRAYQFQRPLLGERFAQLCGPQVPTQVYDLTISRSFDDEPPSYTDIEEEEREREQCEYELAQRIEMLRNLPYERPGQQQTGQGQGPRVYRPREQVVTVIDDVGPHAMNFFRNDNSEHPRNGRRRHREDPAPPLLHHASRSCQELTASHQASAPSCQVSASSCQLPAASRQASAPSCQISAPSCQLSAASRQASAPSCQISAPSCQVSAAACQASAPSCQISAPSCQVSAEACQASAPPCQISAPSCQVSAAACQASAPPCQASASQQASTASSTMSHQASSDNRRDNMPHFLHDHSGYSRAEENANPHP